MKASAAGIDRYSANRPVRLIASCIAPGAVSAAYIHGARVLNDVIGLLADEIAVIDKAIGAGPQP